MLVLRNTAIAVGLAAAVMTMAAAPGLAGPVPANVAALKPASSTDAVLVRWARRGWLPGVVAGGLAAGVTLNPHRYECGYYPCPAYEPAYIPYAYYGAPYYRGFYHWWYNRYYWCAYGCW